MARKTSKLSRNRLLASLTAADLAPLQDHFERVVLAPPAPLSKAGRPINAAYFPEEGMISLVQTLEDGTTIEVGLIGNEGFFGVPLLLGARTSPVEAMVQGQGTALRIPANILVAEAAANERLRGVLLRYAQALITQITQTAACNGRHGVQRRLARWLLEAHDRLGGDDMALSHEFLSFMLGCRRSGITVALGELNDDGLIDARRGRIAITDRKGLESVACECYRTVQQEFRRLLP